MLAEAAGFAILATLSPTALAVMTFFLGSVNPRRTALLYVAGAMLMTIVMAVAMLYAIRAAGLNLRSGYDARYGLRLAVGILSLALGVVLGIRGPREPRKPREDKPARGVMSRLVSRPTARAAFVAGLVVFTPTTTFIAAVQVIATANADVPATALGLTIVVLLRAMIPWVPLLAYLAAPDATAGRLGAWNTWLRVHGRTLTIAVLAICGIALVVNGTLGLATGP
jgi:hypothetical protein